MKGIRPTATADTMRAMTPQMVLDLCAMKLNAPRALNEKMQLEFRFDNGWSTRLVLANGVVHYSSASSDKPDATIATTGYSLGSMANALTSLTDEVANGSTTVTGDRAAFERFLDLLDQFELFFAIIEP